MEEAEPSSHPVSVNSQHKTQHKPVRSPRLYLFTLSL